MFPGSYVENHALSLGSTTVSSVNRTRTRRSSDVSADLYVSFFCTLSLLTSGRNGLRSRYRSRALGSLKYCACTTDERVNGEYAAASMAASAARQNAPASVAGEKTSHPGSDATPWCGPPIVTSVLTLSLSAHRCVAARIKREPCENPMALKPFWSSGIAARRSHASATWSLTLPKYPCMVSAAGLPPTITLWTYIPGTADSTNVFNLPIVPGSQQLSPMPCHMTRGTGAGLAPTSSPPRSSTPRAAATHTSAMITANAARVIVPGARIVVKC